MRAHRLQLDTRGRVLLAPALQAATGLAPGMQLRMVVEDGELLVQPGASVGKIRIPTLDRKGRLTLPGALRKSLDLAPGAVLLLRVDAPGLRLATPERLVGRLKAARVALSEALGE